MQSLLTCCLYCPTALSRRKWHENVQPAGWIRLKLRACSAGGRPGRSQQISLAAREAIQGDECRTTLHRRTTLVTHTRRLARELCSRSRHQRALRVGACEHSSGADNSYAWYRGVATPRWQQAACLAGTHDAPSTRCAHSHPGCSHTCPATTSARNTTTSLPGSGIPTWCCTPVRPVPGWPERSCPAAVPPAPGARTGRAGQRSR